MRKTHIRCLCDDVLGLMNQDGLSYLFEFHDIVHLLAKYSADSGGWYFGESRDRYIAEHWRQYIAVNPQFVTANFKHVIYGEDCHV